MTEDVPPTQPLRVRTLEILWHYNERSEAEQLGMQRNVVEGITSIDSNPAHNRIVTTGGDMCVRLWQLHPAAIDTWLENSISDMSACVEHVCTMRTLWMPLTARWSPHGEMIASAHCDGKICLWWRDSSYGRTALGVNEVRNSAGQSDFSTEQWKDYRHLSGHISDVYDICFSPNSRYLLSGASDGSIVIHDLEGSSLPVAQLAEAHSQFCRGVAWDPWNRYLCTFGSCPALQCFTHVPQRDAMRIQLAGQRRCQGDFLGESCALSFRRMSWSPDGVLLAVPFGKSPQVQLDRNKRISQEVQPHISSLSANGNNASSRAAEEMLHCIYLYARGTMGKPAARLSVRGFNEVRGALWAPCFLEPLQAAATVAYPIIIENQAQCTDDGVGMLPASASTACAPLGEAPQSSPQRPSYPEACGSWGPTDYRMALAAWTADGVVVYTTDASARHSDFTDLHMRSIVDVAWSGDAKYLYTASLDGYISVIAFGESLTPAHRLPYFSSKVVTKGICTLLSGLAKEGELLEAKRSTRLANEAPSGSSATTVAVRKKKKVENSESGSREMQLRQLEALLTDV